MRRVATPLQCGWTCIVPLAILGLAAGVVTSCTANKASGSPPSPAVSAAPATVSSASSAPGLAVALKATASITFQSAGFTKTYTLDSDSNPANGLTTSSGQAFLDLGTSSGQELHVTVIGDGAPGAMLRGATEILASFTDSVAHVGGIATVGQGTCTLLLTRFGPDGLAGSLDCENVAPLMGAGGPVGFTASLNALPG